MAQTSCAFDGISEPLNFIFVKYANAGVNNILCVLWAGWEKNDNMLNKQACGMNSYDVVTESPGNGSHEAGVGLSVGVGVLNIVNFKPQTM